MDSYIASPTRYDESEKIYRRCGKSGILLPKVSLGFWQNFGDSASYGNCREIARMAFDNGVTHFDLANNYGPPPGAAEIMFGRIMKDDFMPYRDEMIISTKAGYLMWPGPYGEWGSRKYLISSLDQSLKRMGLDYVDIFYTHRFDPNTPMEETLQTLVDIVRSGKALYAGISNWPIETLEFASKYLRDRDVPPLIYQGKLNRLHTEPIDTGITEFCKENGMGFIAFSPLAQGLLTPRYLNGIPQDSRMALGGSLTKDSLTPELIEYLRKLNAEAAERGETLVTDSIKWVLEQAGVTSVIVGARTPEQFSESLKCLY